MKNKYFNSYLCYLFHRGSNIVDTLTVASVLHLVMMKSVTEYLAISHDIYITLISIICDYLFNYFRTRMRRDLRKNATVRKNSA